MLAVRPRRLHSTRHGDHGVRSRDSLRVREGPFADGLPSRVRHPPSRLLHDSAAAQSVIATASSFLSRPWLSRRRRRRRAFRQSPARAEVLIKRCRVRMPALSVAGPAEASGSPAASLAMFAAPRGYSRACRVNVWTATSSDEHKTGALHVQHERLSGTPKCSFYTPNSEHALWTCPDMEGRP